MKITVYGAEGEIGQKVISYALSRGDFVTACICDARILWPRKNLTVIEGTVTNREKVMEAMLEADIVISALTGECTDRKSNRAPVSDGTSTIIAAMEQLGKNRLVVLGSICIHAFGDQQNLMRRFHPRIAAILYSEKLRDIHSFSSELDNGAGSRFSGERGRKRIRSISGRQPLRHVGVAE